MVEENSESTMFWVYSVYNAVYKKVYIGQTENIERRIKEHNDQFNPRYKFTRRFTGKWGLIYSEQVNSRKEALASEKQLKSYKGREYLRAYIPR